MNPFPRSPEAIAAQKAYWEAHDRRLPANASFRAEYERAFPAPKPTICRQCGTHLSGPVTIDNANVILWVVCPECRSNAVAHLTDTEPRDVHGFPVLPCERMNVSGLRYAVPVAAIVWAVIYLIARYL